MKFHLGYYKPAGTFKVPEFMFVTKYFYIDIDFTPWKQAKSMHKWFPVGWCGAVGFPGGEPPWKYHFHTSWYAWQGEPDRIDIKIGEHGWHYESARETPLSITNAPGRKRKNGNTKQS